MRAATYHRSSYIASRRRRAAPMLLALAVNGLLLLALLTLGPAPDQRRTADRPFALFDLSPGAGEPPAAEKRRTPRKIARAKSSTAAPPPPVRTSPDTPDATPFEWLQLTHEQYAASDIGSIPRAEVGQAGAEGAAQGEAAGSVYGPGEGPGGARLYNAQWVREPTDAELSFYLPKSIPPGSWAMIACRTIPDNRVENCRGLGDSSPGSGLAEGLRRAAWQFHVRPPRIGGKPIIGAWVRIRIDFTEHGARPR